MTAPRYQVVVFGKEPGMVQFDGIGEESLDSSGASGISTVVFEMGHREGRVGGLFGGSFGRDDIRTRAFSITVKSVGVEALYNPGNIV